MPNISYYLLLHAERVKYQFVYLNFAFVRLSFKSELRKLKQLTVL